MQVKDFHWISHYYFFVYFMSRLYIPSSLLLLKFILLSIINYKYSKSVIDHVLVV